MFDSIIILGPTATGKTKVAIELAKILNTEIINADSMYIYKNLNIGTAKPDKNEMQGIKHHLIDIVDAGDSFNVSQYRMLAENVIKEFIDTKKIPVIVGGTGFYIDSLITNYSYGVAEKSDEIRNNLLKEYEELGKEHLYRKLQNLDPESASKIDINDTKRIVRAIEICLITGNKKSNIVNNEKPLLSNPLLIGLNTDREFLYSRINKRVDIMANNGLLQEVTDLYNQGLNPNTHQSMKGIGYKEIIDFIEGKTSYEDAIEKIKQHTRNYAKRQITWFKRNKDIIWMDSMSKQPFEIAKDIYNIYNS